MNPVTDTFEKEVREKSRFRFGKNWSEFLSVLNEDRIKEAKLSLQNMLDVEDLKGKRFLDIGSGSGLFSLAARSLGAQVFSFDFDPDSVACTQTLKDRYFPNDSSWTIQRGSALDKDYVSSLGKFDVVYSWGVLHHTGSMWEALENASLPAKSDSKLFVAIYNDQGILSDFWRVVKKFYCSGFLRIPVLLVFIPYFFLRALMKSVLTQTNVFSEYKRNRGMSITHDWIDWLGGLPFEVASVQAIQDFYSKRGFDLVKVKKTSSLGNNEFVFVKK